MATYNDNYNSIVNLLCYHSIITYSISRCRFKFTII